MRYADAGVPKHSSRSWGTGGHYPLEFLRYDGVPPVAGVFWSLNFGAKKNTLTMEESRPVDGPNLRGNCRPKLWIKNDDFAVTRAALKAADAWGDERVSSAAGSSDGKATAVRRTALPQAAGSNSFPNP